MVEPPATTLPLLLVLLVAPSGCLPVEALVVDELGVLGGDDRALEVRRDPARRRPSGAAVRPRGFFSRSVVEPRLHERACCRGLIESHHSTCAKNQHLHAARAADARAAPTTARQGPAPHPPHAAARSIAITGAVSGRTPRQMKNDSAACSTSMPRPSATRAAPASRGKLQERRSRPCRTSCRRRARRRAKTPAAAAARSLQARRGGVDDEVERPAGELPRKPPPAPARCAPRETRAPARRALSTRAVGDDEARRARGEQRPEHAPRRAAGAEQQHAPAGDRDSRDCRRGRAPGRRRRCCRRRCAVASKRQRVDRLAGARAVRCARSRAANASSLNGSVTLSPRPPAARNAAHGRARSRRAARAGARTRCPARSARANAAWISGDLLCAIGLPMTA